MKISTPIKFFAWGVLALIALTLVGTIIAGFLLGRADFERRHFALQTLSPQADSPQFRIVPDYATQNDSRLLVGDSIRVEAKIELSYGYDPNAKVSLQTTPGIMLSGDIQTHYAFTFRRHELSVAFSLLPYREGVYDNLKLICAVRGITSSHADTQLSIPLPTLYAALPDNPEALKDFAVDSAVLFTADTVQPLPTPLSFLQKALIAAAGVLILCLIITVFVFLRRKHIKMAEKRPDAWVVAARALRDLSDGIQAGSVTYFKAVARVTDIVRSYLTERFNMHADTMTTPEFFAYIESRKSPLHAQHKIFLRDFLAKADMIKFAGVSAERETIENAIESAQKLVVETIPDPMQGGTHL